MTVQKIDITGPLYQYTNNDARLIQHQFNDFDENDEVEIFWHCPGGDTREANKIFTTIMNHKGKTTSKIILAASAGSYASMGADRLEVYDYSEFMIHSAMMRTCLTCNRAQIDKMIEFIQSQKPVLEILDSQIAEIYAKRSGIDKDKVIKWMNEETTWRGEEIKKAGFATDFVDTPPREIENLARFDLSSYENLKDSRWHQQYSNSIEPEEAWLAQMDDALSQQQIEDPKKATVTENIEDPAKLARVAAAKRRMERLAIEKKLLLGK